MRKVPTKVESELQLYEERRTWILNYLNFLKYYKKKQFHEAVNFLTNL